MVEVWPSNASGVLLNSSAADAIFEVNGITNSDITSAALLYSYFSFSGSRVSDFDNYGIELSGGSSVIEPGKPVVLTSSSSQATTKITVNGNVTSDNGGTVTERGFVYGTSENPTTSNTKIIVGSGTGTFSGTTPDLSAGTYYFRTYATNSTGTSYGSEVSYTITLPKTDQTITFNTLSAKTYGDAVFNLTATASSTLDVSYTSSNTAVATVSGSAVTIVGQGTTTIIASQAGNASYNAAVNVSQTLTVNKKSITVTGATAANKVYDGTTVATISGASLVGVVGSDDVTLSNATVGAFSTASSGTNISVITDMLLTGAASDNYTLVQPTLKADIIGLVLTITNAVVDNKVYDGTTDAVVSGATLIGIIGSDDVTLAASTTGNFATANVGSTISVTTEMSLEGADASKYMIEQPVLTADITAKELTIIGADADKEYDGTNEAIITGATLVGVIGLDEVNLVAPIGTFTSVNVGTGISVTADLTITGAESGNYILTQPTLTADITARTLEIAAATGQTKIVGETDPVFAYSITGDSLVDGDFLTGSLSRTEGETAGNYPIQIGTLTAGDNYSISFIPADFVITTINNAEITVADEIRIYPNPTNGILTLIANEGQLKLVNLEGKVLIEALINNQRTIDISNQPAGVYILILTTHSSVNQFKIIRK